MLRIRRGVVVAMRSGPQMLACWRWLRAHEAAHPAGPGLHSGRGHVRLPMEGPAPWWHAAAAEMLFGSAPFEVHPHHMRTMQEGILTVFASMLVRKMMAAWMQEVRNIRDLLQQLKQQIKLRTMESWKGAAAKCRRLREQELHVSNQRNHQMMTRSIRHWEQRWSKLVQHRSSLQEFDVACWHRSCRRAMDAWLMVVRWEAFTVRRQKASRIKLQSTVFQSWVVQCRRDRKEAAVLRLSSLFPRKRGLRRGIQAFRCNVKAQAHEMALKKVQQTTQLADRRLLEACWAALLRNLERCQLMILYLGWADAKRVRRCLGAAFHGWLLWKRERKTPAVHSGVQVFASWQWLRVHAASRLSTPKFAPGRRGVTVNWWHAAAAELLYDLAPFDIHPHRLRAVQEGILTVFASMLVRKMMAAWMQEVRNIRDLLQQLKQQIKLRTMESWKGTAAKCRRLREQELHVSNQRNHQMMIRSIRHWEKRWSKLVQHRSSLQEFDVACWHRSCRRAMDAWLMVVRWEAFAVRRQKASNIKLQSTVFQSWVVQWRRHRTEALLLDRCTRKLQTFRLLCSLRAWQKAKHDEALAQALLRRTMLGWIQRYRKNLSLRIFATRVYSRSRKDYLVESFNSWAEVTSELASLETRYLLQASDLQARLRSKARLSFFRCWRSEVESSLMATSMARKRKVFACWRLATQEQLLLQTLGFT